MFLMTEDWLYGVPTFKPLSYGSCHAIHLPGAYDVNFGFSFVSMSTIPFVNIGFAYNDYPYQGRVRTVFLMLSMAMFTSSTI